MTALFLLTLQGSEDSISECQLYAGGQGLSTASLCHSPGSCHAFDNSTNILPFSFQFLEHVHLYTSSVQLPVKFPMTEKYPSYLVNLGHILRFTLQAQLAR